MKEYYLATYKKTDGNYGTALVLSESEAKAEEHFKGYDLSTVRIAAEDDRIAAYLVSCRNSL